MKKDNSWLEIDEVVDPVVRRAIDDMRATERIPHEWRAELLSKVPKRRRRPTRVWWAPVGLAAALCLGVGLTVVNRRSEATITTGTASVVRFSIRAPAAARVSLVGDFDRWDPAAMPMRRDGNGETWMLDVHLPPGRHVFAYSVDGNLETDPMAARAVEDDFGVPSSVIVVASLGGESRR